MATHEQVGAKKQVEITIRIPMVDKVMKQDNSAPPRSADLCQSLGRLYFRLVNRQVQQRVDGFAQERIEQ
tara:strand:+ start:193 stop:402 length:210 start_codon:yes stop_codon:yes gene_type:complete